MKIIRAAERGPRYRLTPKEAAQHAAMERRLSQYIPLSCGHYTTYDYAIMTAVWAPENGVYYCENHDQWVSQAVKHRPETSDIPPY